jgi:Protein of unknown function with HXXEE motif
MAGMTALLRKVFWLLPTVYIAHNIEEYCFIGFFAEKHNIRSWLAESPEAIIYATVIGVLSMAACYVYRNRAGANFWLTAIIGALFLNGLTHLFQAIYFLDYVPGLITSLIFYLPICGYLLISSFRGGIFKTKQIPVLALASILITAGVLALSFGITAII